MTDTQKQICHSICKHYGIESQRRQLVEECAELIQAITKLERYNEDIKELNNLFSEIADVEIMLEQIKDYYSNWSTERLIDYKLNRQLDRITKERG